MNVTGFIFARGGSKGVPRKNVKLLGGKPLIAYAIEAALGSKFIKRVVVSTDDAEIADVARQHGADVPFMRPADLATDKASEWLAWRHAINAVNAEQGQAPLDVFVSVPATSPMRIAADVDACVETHLASKADVTITVTEAHRSPYFNMVVLDDAQQAKLVMANAGQAVTRRQDAPPVYDITTVAYAARPDFVLNANGIFEGRCAATIVPVERSLDIDTEYDWQLAEFLISRRA
jgi:N,N'-diacetyl-8-epilegionaminate cytidylyltransferase